MKFLKNIENGTTLKLSECRNAKKDFKHKVRTILIPSLCGMLRCSALTSMVARVQFRGSLSFSRMLIR